MSHLTKCNYCTLADLKLKFEHRTTRSDRIMIRRSELGGLDVFIHPKTVHYPWENRDEYLIAWFMELSKECVC